MLEGVLRWLRMFKMCFMVFKSVIKCLLLRFKVVSEMFRGSLRYSVAIKNDFWCLNMV